MGNTTERRRSEGELQHAISLLQSTLESTADGLLVVDNAGKMVSFNKRFVSLWQMPQHILDKRDDNAAINHVMSQLKDPDAFLRKIRELYTTPEAESVDVFEFKDGRVMERYSCPHRLDGKPVGRVWSFRNITKRRQAEGALRDSEAFLNTVIEKIPHMIFVKDAKDLRFVKFNKAGQELMGHSLEELIGKNDYDFFPKEMADFFTENDRKVLSGKEVVDIPEEAIQTRDKGKRILHTKKIPVFDNAGQLVYLMGISEDITEHKRAEEALLESQALYSSFVKHLPAGVFRKDYEGRYIFANSEYCRLKNLQPDEILDKTPRELAAYELSLIRAESDKKARQHTLIQGEDHHEWILRTGKPIELEESYPQADGTVEYFHVVKSPVFGSDGQIIGSQGIEIDITERRRLEAQLRQSQKMEAFGQLAAGVAHDFNNILTVIQGNLALLQDGQLSKEEQTSAVAQSMSSALRAADLTRQLLTFGRRQLMRHVDLDLNEVIADTTKMLQRLVGEHIALETRFAPVSALVHADLGMMEQTLMNLAINSRDAMPKGGRLVLQTEAIVVNENDVRLKPKARAGQFIRLSVSDTGCGIAPAHLSRIFEPFFTTKEVGKGTGLGLATVFGIIEQHRGWMEVESEQNKGTTFHIFLPRLPKSKEQSA